MHFCCALRVLPLKMCYVFYLFPRLSQGAAKDTQKEGEKLGNKVEVSRFCCLYGLRVRVQVILPPAQLFAAAANRQIILLHLPGRSCAHCSLWFALTLNMSLALLLTAVD